ncbi:MAG: tetratricopeptide repeat-containing sensor histidine kinase [Bacteroidota bacterium]
MNYNRIIFLSLVFCYIATVVVAQNNRIDSLLSLVNNTESTENINLLNQIAVAYNDIDDLDQSKKYSYRAFESSKKSQYDEGIIQAYNNLASISIQQRKPSEAINYSIQAIELAEIIEKNNLKAKALRNLSSASFAVGEKDSALVKLNEALQIYSNLNDSLNIGMVYSEMGEAYTYLNNSPQMVTSYLNALEIFKKLQNEKRVAITHLNLGSVYSNFLGEYRKAIEHADAALKIYNNLGDEVKTTYCYLIIGSAYEYLGNLDKALEFYNKSLVICRRTDNKYMLANTENYIGEAYNKQHKIKLALESYNKSLNIYLELGDEEGIAVAENNIGECYYKLGDLNKALSHYTRSFEYFDKRGEKFQLSELVFNIGNVYYERKNYNSAINSYRRSIKYAKETNNLESLKDSYKAISNAYRKLEKPERALDYLEMYIEKKDSLINVKNLEMIAEYEAKYEASEKAKEIELLKKEQELSEINVQLQTILNVSLIAVTLLLIATVIIYYRKYKQKNELNQRLAESEIHLQKLNFTKDKFFSIIAHDLRGPLGTLSGLTEILDEDAEEMDKESIIGLSKDIHQISKNTITLLNNLLTWASIQIGKIEISKENFEIKDIVDEVHELLRENLNKKNITFTNEIEKNIAVYADKNMVSSVIRNLIHNAIKFTNESGNVTTYTDSSNGITSISVQDNGVGIPEDNMEKLFEIGNKVSTYGTANESGAGLGLILSKEFIDKNSGTIVVKSDVNKGTTFTINLPNTKKEQ